MFAKRIFGLAVALAVLAVLALGAARPSSGGGAERRYVVRPGDTLWAIAANRYSGDPRRAVWRIEQRNRLSTPLLVPGEILILPP
jgi:nucleoid-associated protein YgaU